MAKADGTNGTNRVDLIKVLNRLVTIHNRSLPVYLANTRPWMRRGDETAQAVLAQMAADHRATVDRLGQMILDYGAVVEPGEFPMRFTSTHDLSLEFLLPVLIRHQQHDLAVIEQCVQGLESDLLAKAAAEETWGEARAHLESLQDLVRDVASAES